MQFGVFYELQLPNPWDEGAEQRLFHEAFDPVALADAEIPVVRACVAVPIVNRSGGA